METRKVFNCFISSPGDCQEERKACQDVIEDINKGQGRRLGVSFETFMWEEDILPDFGKTGQEIINDQMKGIEYDVFIGIMKIALDKLLNKLEVELSMSFMMR